MAENRLLIVDDDEGLLRGLKRNLCLHLKVDIANSGPEGLEKLTAIPFSVVISDMQMPGMNGVKFIQEARLISPHTTYMMLTGNQDMDTAVDAMNEGRVFRFLNKPCDVTTIRNAVALAQKQFELVTAERELLERTVVGAVSVMTDVLETLQPNAAQQARKITEIAESLNERLGLQPDWRLKVVSRLSFLGLALMPTAKQLCLRTQSVSSPAYVDNFKQMTESSARLVAKIPRLEEIAKIISMQSEVGGDFTPSSEGVETPAILVRVAFDWTMLTSRAIGMEAAYLDLHKAFPNLPSAIFDALVAASDLKVFDTTITLSVAQLREGMVLKASICGPAGEILVREGQVLSEATIEKLKLRRGGGSDDFTNILVSRASCESPLTEVQLNRIYQKLTQTAKGGILNDRLPSPMVRG